MVVHELSPRFSQCFLHQSLLVFGKIRLFSPFPIERDRKMNKVQVIDEFGVCFVIDIVGRRELEEGLNGVIVPRTAHETSEPAAKRRIRAPIDETESLSVVSQLDGVDESDVAVELATLVRGETGEAVVSSEVPMIAQLPKRLEGVAAFLVAPVDAQRKKVATRMIAVGGSVQKCDRGEVGTESLVDGLEGYDVVERLDTGVGVMAVPIKNRIAVWNPLEWADCLCWKWHLAGRWEGWAVEV